MKAGDPMSKEDKRILRITAVCIAVFLLAILLFYWFYWLLFDGVIVFDHSGIRYADSFQWKGNHYVLAPGRYDHEGRVLAKTNAGDHIIEVDDDKTHTFLVLRDFLDNDLYVREDYEIPTSGEITKVYWTHAVQDESFCDVLTQILRNAETDFQYVTDAPYVIGDGREMYQLYVGYDHCPIATENLGYLGTINGAWYITTGIEETKDGQHLVSCYQIPSQYVSLLQSFQ